MASNIEIERFLKDFKTKLSFWGLLIRSDREKNFNTMKALEFSINDVKNELKGLEVTHFSDGPIKETIYGGADMWVFGKPIQGKEVYIKITIGQPSNQVLCISFHFAEQSLNYPYKNI